MTTIAVLTLVGTAGLLLLLQISLMRAPCLHVEEVTVGPASLEQPRRRHPTYFPVISQAMSSADFGFLAERASVMLLRRTHKERQRISLLYLVELRRDFDKLLRLARAISTLSPEVSTVDGIERMRLTVEFFCRYQFVLWALLLDTLLLPQLRGLNAIVSQLAVQIESAMKNLGERAYLAAELASPLDRRGLDPA